MSDLIAAIEGFVGDPLVVAVFLLILGAVSARLLFKSNTIGARADAPRLLFPPDPRPAAGRGGAHMSRCARRARRCAAW